MAFHLSMFYVYNFPYPKLLDMHLNDFLPPRLYVIKCMTFKLAVLTFPSA